MIEKWHDSKRLGLMGGTFNPIHIGHLRMAEEFAERYQLDQVLLVPCALPVHRDTPKVSAADRYQMVQLCCGMSEKLSACDIELNAAELGQPNYTVNTLEQLTTILPRDAQLFFLMGTDAYRHLHDWMNPQRITELAQLVVVNRARERLEPRPAWLSALEMAGRIHLEDFSYLDISSTDIRKRIYNKQTIRFLVPNSVENFILDKELYKNYD